MLVKVTVLEVTPQKLARLTLEGGLLYSRVSRANRLQELTRGAEYSRKVREWIPRRSNRDWKTPRAERISYSAGRTVLLSRPPAQRTPGGLNPVRAYPEGWGLPFDGLETAAYWEKRFHRVDPPGGPEGTPHLEVCHRGGANFTAWSIHQIRRGTVFSAGIWGHRPRKEQDPLRGLYDYLHRGGCSPLGGLRGGLSRESQLHRRLSQLYRRQREHQSLNFGLENLKLYRQTHRRKKRPLAEARSLLFRRRRLRGYLTGVVSHRNYINRLTRRGFYRWHPNRWARLEKASLLGSTYVEARVHWGHRLLGSRVGSPLEYHLYSPFAGFGRLIKRRREGSRRWKLAQHSLWGPPHLEARQARWSWFKETPLGALLERATPPGRAPHRGGLPGGVYWSSRVWGRSRWDRPTGRGVTGFIWSLKGGTTVEKESHQWGRAGTSGVGILLSLVGELELRSIWSWVAPSRVILPQPRGWLARGEPLLLLKWGIWLVVATVWSIFTPLWWVYSGIARTFCYLGWWFRRGWFGAGAITSALYELWGRLVYQWVVYPVSDYITHWVKDTPFFKTASWVWTSWLLVYSSDEDQRKLDLTPVEPTDEPSQEYFLDEIEPTDENIPEEDSEVEIHLHEGIPRTALRQAWAHSVDFAWDEGIDAGLRLLTEEIPYRIGFLFQPLIDVVLRLPLWGFLEGATLLILAAKLQYQQSWSSLLHRGGGLTRGRWWKIPLLLVKGIIHLLIWISLIWGVGSTLSYSTLRLEIVLWGWPWHEEYYLFWWVIVTVGVTRLVGPAGVKDFFFHELGWSNLVGLFWGATEVAQPEEYQPNRPISLFSSVPRSVLGINMRRHRSYEDVQYHTRETDFYAGAKISSGFDETRLIIAQSYEYGDYLNWEEVDEVNYFNVPIHLVHSLEEETNSPYAPLTGLPEEDNDFRRRSLREPHLIRNNYYEITYYGNITRDQPPLYFLEDITNGHAMGGHYVSESTRLQHLSRDDSQIQNSSDFTSGE